MNMRMGQFPKGEEGSILIWAAVGFAVLIAFAGLATDIPYLYVARQQAQTAADAGALAGAYGLIISQARAVTDAGAFAGRTPIIGQLLTPGPPQVEVFLESSFGGATPDQVRTITHRDLAGGNPLPLFLLPVLQLFGLGRNTADVSATATARILNTCSSDCFKPWSVADRWDELSIPPNGRFDAGTDLYDPAGTGYNLPADNGVQVVLKVGNPQATITPGFFYAVDFPPLNRGTPATGGQNYRDNIAACGPDSFVAIGDQLQVEPGNMVGPTRQGVQDLYALDPSAFWDTACVTPGGCMSSSMGTSSPRLIRMGLFDPSKPVDSGRNFVTVIKIGGFFIEGVQSNGDVTGRYTLVASQGGIPDPACSFLQVVQLVQ